MDWRDTESQADFRNSVRAFLAERMPSYYRKFDDLTRDGFIGWYYLRSSPDPAMRDATREWAEALAEQGWVAPSWPREYGGAGLSVMEQFIFSEEMTRAGAPLVGASGVQMLGPTLIAHGTEEQKRRVLPGIASGNRAWVQGYSEPGAGSDLASLTTRAVRDGDQFVVNGQKIWTTNAHVADAIFMLVRTDPEAPKHRGISFLLVDDIHMPGITVRPLIDAAWDHHLNETFFEDVRVPVGNVVGGENRGWYVAMTLLDFERSGVASAVAHEEELRDLIEFLQTEPGADISRVGKSSTVRAELADRWIESHVGYNLTLRIATLQAAGVTSTYETSVGAVFGKDFSQRIPRTAVKIFGLYGGLWPGEQRAPLGGRFTRTYVTSITAGIAGGTTEIQRNIVATRGLGLPRG